MKKTIFFLFLSISAYAQPYDIGYYWVGRGIQGLGTESSPLELADQATNTLLGNPGVAVGPAVALTHSVEFIIDGTVFKHTNKEVYAEFTSTSSPILLNSLVVKNVINQGGTQATFTLELPGSPEDGQLCEIIFGNAITVLTIDGNGETVLGALPTSAAIANCFEFIYITPLTAWIRTQ